jgi:hypothetical protein
MRKTFLLLISLFCLSEAFSQYATLFKDCKYRGQSRVLYPGRYSLDQVGFAGGSLSSIRIPRGLKVVVYDGYQPGTGDKIRFTGDVECLGSGWNDRARSVVIEYDNTGGNPGYNNNNQPNYNVYPSYGGSSGAQVMVYEDCSFHGYSSALSPGRYDVRAMGVHNDAISSLRIPSGYSVTVYRDAGFRGESQTYYANVYCVSGKWNDEISSIVVRGPGGYVPENNYNNNQGQANNVDFFQPAPSYNGVMVYMDSWYKGGHTAFYEGYHDLRYGNFRGNISSISIQQGYRVIVYDGENYRGKSSVFTSSVPNLSSLGWNDRIRSLQVVRNY